MTDAISGDGTRWAIVVMFFVAAVMTTGSLLMKLRNARTGHGPLISRSERAVHVGGAAICFLVASGTLGVLMGWDPVFRLPFLLAAGAFIVYGRGREWRDEYKAGRRKY